MALDERIQAHLPFFKFQKATLFFLELALGANSGQNPRPAPLLQRRIRALLQKANALAGGSTEDELPLERVAHPGDSYREIE